MAEKIIVNGGAYYRCSECGYIYASEETAKRCEEWCGKNKSCNLEIIKEAVFRPDGSPANK